MAFEGSEHLQNILSELADLVDVKILAYQDMSYHGDPIDPSDKATILNLVEQGFADQAVKIELNPNEEARLQETAKRNKIIDLLKKEGCSHAVIIDADEFYTYQSFYYALKEIDENDYDVTYCQYVNYYHDYEHYLIYPFSEGMYVPFVSKIKYKFFYESEDFMLPSDPTRRYVLSGNKKDKQHIFSWDKLKMHHLSWIRIDIKKKLRAWSSRKCFDNTDFLIKRAIDDFNNFTPGTTKVHIIFNTPDNAVKVGRFPKQYIFPHYDYKTTYINVTNDTE